VLELRPVGSDYSLLPGAIRPLKEDWNSSYEAVRIGAPVFWPWTENDGFLARGALGCRHLEVYIAKMESEHATSTPELKPTLWRCRRCAALVSIYSVDVIDEAICPICCDVTLDSRGSFETILGIAFPYPSPVASPGDPQPRPVTRTRH
jgi:hypothetical protein